VCAGQNPNVVTV